VPADKIVNNENGSHSPLHKLRQVAPVKKPAPVNAAFPRPGPPPGPVPPVPPRRRSAAAARENILQAAEAILRSQGPLELKLATVAAAAGVSTATVLHHFGAIDDVQTALMERMVTRLAARVVQITEAAPRDQPPNLEGAQALFDAFEEQGAARLAAWLVMTGEARRLSVVRRAVDQVIDSTLARLSKPPKRVVLEDMILASITTALGSGLFGEALSALLGRPPGSARAAAIAALAAGANEMGFG
jgi:AcrR family transcriptional regulator